MTKFWVCPACDKRVEEYNEVVLMSGEHIRATVGKRLYGRLSDGKVYMFMVHILWHGL